jgi:hypothetical protein
MFRSRKPSCRQIGVALVIALGLMIPPARSPAWAQGNPNPGIVPNNARYQTLSAQWWQWALSVPAAVNPITDPTGVNCAQGQGILSNNVWFLAGTFGGSATRSCTIPLGKSLFFPLLNTVYACDAPPAACPGGVAALRAAAAAEMDAPLLLEASIDGVPVQALSSYRAASSVFSLELAADNVLGAAAGT